MTTFVSAEFFSRLNDPQHQNPRAQALPANQPRHVSELVMTAVDAVAQDELVHVAARDAALTFQPRALLAVLVYCYVKGIYASQDIEDMMRRDGALRKHSANDLPGWRILRRFRRNNREPIQRCLAATLRQQAIESLNPALARRAGGIPADDRFDHEAASRIENAMLMDLMAHDCDEW